MNETATSKTKGEFVPETFRLLSRGIKSQGQYRELLSACMCDILKRDITIKAWKVIERKCNEFEKSGCTNFDLFDNHLLKEIGQD